MNKPELAHLINLISVAMIDGNISDSEKDLLYNIAETLGATKEEFEFCVDQAQNSKDRVIIEAPDTDEEKTFFLKNLTLMMMADGQIDDTEKQYIKFIAEHFGYDGDKALNILIESVSNDIRQAFEKQQNNPAATTQESCRPEGTRESGKKDDEIDEEALKAEIREAIQKGKEALMKHDIPTAFDHLFYAAHMDRTASRLFLMILNLRSRLFSLSKEQIALMKNYAEKGYALSQYAYGRLLEAKRPENDSLTQANEYFKEAEKAGMPDALYVQAILMKAGHYGLVNRAEVNQMINQASEKGSFLANKYLLRNAIYGWDGTEPDPQKVINTMNDWLKDNGSDDLLVVDPAYYHILGEAYAILEDNKNAEHYFLKAINMGYTEAYGDLYYLYLNTDDERAEEVLNEGCNIADPYSLLYHASELMDGYDDMNSRSQKAATPDIMHDLITATEAGSDMAPYFMGYAYYNGFYGFEKDLTKAWDWFIEGSHRDDGSSYRMLAIMVSNDEVPYEIKDMQKLMEHLSIMALRNGDDDMLDIVVEGYRNGDFTDYAAEIEQYYIPEHDRNHENDDREDPDDYDYKLIAIVKTNGKADIIEFDVEEGWDELPEFIGANRLDAIRTQPLYDITEQLDLDGHITAWVDNMGLMKDLPMNPIGSKLYPGPIAGDMILTLEDAKYNPMSFESIEELKQVIAALGAELDQILLDDGPDDDGRYDAWS